MSKMKRYFTLALCLLLVFSLMLSACGSKDKGAGADDKGADTTQPTEAPQSNEATYKVTVVDGLGKAYTEKLIVKFLQNGKQVAMGAINDQGYFEKVLTKGEYDIEIASTNNKLECNYIATKLTADATEAKVVMAYAPTNFNSITAPSVSTGEYVSYEAAMVDVGSSYIELDSSDRVYALFTPTQPGTYKFSITNEDAVIGYYGSPYYVQSSNVADHVDGNTFTMSIDAGMIGEEGSGTTVLVIGMDAKEGKEGCILNIDRIGDPAWTIESEPWQKYQAKAPVTDFVLQSGVELVDFDITAETGAYKLVLNETDGIYHLGTADGPKVYVQLAEAVYGISMKDMVGEIVYDAEGILISTGTAPFRYQYNNGKTDFFKEDYTDFMRQVVTAADKASGVYPLTEDLYYVLPMGIENKGWCKQGVANYLFNGVDANPEIAWMFMLCHEVGTIPSDPVNPDTNPGNTETKPTGPIEDNKDEPEVIGSTLSFEVSVQANHIYFVDLLKVNDTILTIKSKDAYVIYNGVTYEAVNGVVTVPNLYSQYTNIPVSIQIGNKGTKDAVFAVTLSYPEGHRENPVKLPMKSFSVDLKKNNEQGVYYAMTATNDGKLTVSLDKVTSTSGSVQAGLTVTVTGEDLIPHQYQISEVGAEALVVDVKAGENVVINICVLPNAQNRYLAATVDVTASFE